MGTERTPSDATPVRRCRRGDAGAFVELVRRHEQPLAALIRYQVGDAHHAEDVLQETLLRAWVNIRRLRDPAKARPWLLQVARNLCRDHFRARGKRPPSLCDQHLDEHMNRHGRAAAHEEAARHRAGDALDAVPEPERGVAELFYLRGLTIAEIAARAGRRRARSSAGSSTHAATCATHWDTRDRKGEDDEQTEAGIKRQPFPLTRPAITIKPSRARPFALDFRELPGWFAIPVVGHRSLWCIYDPPDWRPTSVTLMHGLRPAIVHGLECVEFDTVGWNAEDGWEAAGDGGTFVRETEQRVEWVAECRDRGGTRTLWSFLDDGFEENWGGRPRHMADIGRLRTMKDGTCRLKKPPHPVVHDSLASGIFRVGVGERRFTCLRCIGLGSEPSERGKLHIAFVTRRGRTVYWRRYNGRMWNIGPDRPPHRRTPWDEQLPDHDRIVINGVTYVHWYDCLSHVSLGIDLSDWAD